jgi:magnesium-transporting ATPase (P-type)
MTARVQPQAAWHVIEPAELMQLLETGPRGLRASTAAQRLVQFGPNILPQRPPDRLWQVVLRQFRDPLIYTLAAAAAVSLAIGDIKDAAFIAGVLVLNGVIGAYQEWKAEQSNLALRRLLQIRATVDRDGEVREVSADEIVPGDVVWLESGNRVPADIRLLTTHGVEADESLLTGESLPVLKDPGWNGAEATPVSDRQNMAYAGSIVTRGRAKGVVVATGTATNLGQLALDVLGETSGKPPLLVRMERFTRAIAAVMLSVACGIAVLGIVVGGYTLSEMFLFAVALTVSAIPEGLPVAMTVALAVATSRMARRGLIVRRLTAVEGLGSCTLIATDKTGTLTCNELTVHEIQLPGGDQFQVTGEGFDPTGEILQEGQPVKSGNHSQLEALLRAGMLCNEADLHQRDGGWVWRGDAVDIALLALGRKLNQSHEALLDSHPQINQIPFEAEHQFAASYHRVGDEVRVFVKGAPERVLAMCTQGSDDSLDRSQLDSSALQLAEQGYRVLALAEAVVPPDLSSHAVPLPPGDLRFLGFVGMIDPLRPGAKDAVEKCHSAGVKVTMITGDHRVTALAIARELGLADHDSQVVTGADLSEKTPEQLQEIVHRVRVFARVAPRQKLQIVEAAQKAGHFVAVTGDGVNDAPALRAANIGVAMGKAGTDVAREAAELVISDDNFATIVGGVEEGRVAYNNIRKVIYLVVSTGAAELVLMTLAIATGTPYLPLLPVQLLWLNLVTNGIQDVALAFEPNEGDVLQQKPRSPLEPIFDRLMIHRTVLAAVVMGVVGFLTFHWYLPDNPSEADIRTARNALLLLMVLFENIHIGNCRSETRSALRLSPLKSPILLSGAIAAFLLHVAAMHSPIGQLVLETQPLPLADWGLLLLMALIIFPTIELHKILWNKSHRNTTTEAHAAAADS